MDSGRFILAVVLMVAVMVITNILFPPARKPAAINADSIAADSLRRLNAPAHRPHRSRRQLQQPTPSTSSRRSIATASPRRVARSCRRR